jgi:hypothetical protein
MVRAMDGTADRAVAEPRSRPGSWAGIWLRLVGTAAARRAIPVWAGTGIAAAVLFSGTGLHAGDATGVARAEPLAGAALALMWLVLIAPVGAAIRTAAPGWLRALPGARGTRWAVIGAIAVAVQAPWAALWTIGDGLVVGAGATGAAAIAMLVLGGARWPMRTTAPRWRTAIGALTAVHARAIIRRRGAALVRALAWALVIGAMAGLIVRSNQLDGDGVVAAVLVAVALAVPLGLAGLVAPVIESDRAAAWVAGADRARRIAAQTGALAGFGAALAVATAAIAVVLGAIGAAAAIAPVALAALTGAALGGLATRIGAWAAAAPSGFDGTRVVAGLVLAAVASAMTAGAIGGFAVVVLTATAAGLVGSLAAPR